MALPLFLSVLLIAACGLIYELVASALASYLLGDSVTQFSTVIGTYLFAMGVGSWLSRFLSRGLVARFVTIELLVGLVGGFSSTILFLAFAYTGAFRLVLYVLVVILGIFVGLEIPLLMRILKDRYAFKDVVANVLTFDYLGALAASLAFPILLVPKLGLVRSALLFGIVNAGVALWSVWLFRAHLGARRVLGGASVVVLAAPLRRHGERDEDHQPRRGQHLLGRGDLRAQHALPAHRAHRVEGRPAALAQLAPPVQLARRVPLSRGARASRALGAAERAARARAGRRRRARRARAAQVSRRSSRSRWSISIRR